MQAVVRVFVSSTWKDLQPERRAVLRALARLKEVQAVGMEDFGSHSETTRATSIREVDTCDLFLLIVGESFGSGIVTAEYERALSRIPIHVYSKIDDEDAVADTALRDLLHSLKQKHTVPRYRSSDELATLVTADLHRWLVAKVYEPELQRAATGKPSQADIAAILRAIPNITLLPEDLRRRLREQGFEVPRFALAPLPSPLMFGRDSDLGRLEARLAAPVTAHRVIAIRGWPGIGKTTFSKALAHDERFAAKTPDGRLWVSLGKRPDVGGALIRWIRALDGVPPPRNAPVEEIGAQLSLLLEGRKILLVIDDVWQAADAAAFLEGGEHCIRIVTSRFPDVANRLASTAGDIYVLKGLADDDALELLANFAGPVVEKHMSACRKLAQAVEGSPLALRVAAPLLLSEVQIGGDVEALVEEICHHDLLLDKDAPADLVDLADLTCPSIAALLRRSTDRLDAKTQARFAMLGGFRPRPATFDIGPLRRLWKDGVEETIRILFAHGLIEPASRLEFDSPDSPGGQKGRFEMHALLISLAASMLTP